MALVIGLGGKSSATNRAPNMTEFIKQGSSWGQVTITICNANHNHDAWEYEVRLYEDYFSSNFGPSLFLLLIVKVHDRSSRFFSAECQLQFKPLTTIILPF